MALTLGTSLESTGPGRPVQLGDFALSNEGSPLEALPHWTGRDQDKRGFGDVDKE